MQAASRSRSSIAEREKDAFWRGGGLSLAQLDLDGTLYVSGNCNIQQVNITGGGKLISNGDWRTLTVGGNFVMDGDQIAMHTFLPPGTSMRWKKGMLWGNLDQSGGALLFLEGAGDHTLNACTVTLNGATTWSDAGKIVQVGGTDTAVNIINKGTFLASGSGSFVSGGYLYFNFINESAGEFIKQGGVTSFTSPGLSRPMNFLNRGIVDVRSGILDFPVGMFSLENGCTVKGTGTVRVSGGLLYLPPGSTSTVTGVLELSAGLLEGDGMITGVGGTFNWTGGSFGTTQNAYTDPRLATLNVPPGMTMNISGDIDKRLGSNESFCGPCHRQHGVIKNAGTVNWTGTGDIFTSYGGGEIINSGLFLIHNDVPFRVVTDGGTLANTSTGILRKVNGSGTTTFPAGFGLSNQGTVDIQKGTIEVTSHLRMLDGSAYSGAGKLISTGTGNIAGTATISGSVEMRAGKLRGGEGEAAPIGTLATTGSGAFRWTGGNLLGTVNIAANSQFLISGTGNKLLGYFLHNDLSSAPLTLNNRGTITWTDTGNLVDANTGIINNTGTFIARNSATLGFNQFNNHGTFRRDQGGTTNVTEFTGGTFNHYGTLNVTSGEITSKNFVVLHDNSIITGAGRIASTAGVSLIASVNISGGTFEQRANAFRGGANGIIRTSGSGKFEWTGGNLTQTVSLEIGSVMNITGDAEKALGHYFGWQDNAPGTFNNRGTVTWTGTGNIVDANTGIINNTGTFIARNSATLGFNQFHNHGIFRREQGGATNITDFIGGAFNHYGTLDVVSGEVAAKSPMVLHDNSIITGAGRCASAAGVTLLASVSINNGTFEHRASLFRGGANGIIRTSGSGKFEWTGGNLTQTVSLESGSVMQISGAADKALGHYYGWQDNAVGTFNNRGTVTWTGSGGILDHNTGSLNNAGTFLVRTASPLQGRILNTGVLDVGSPGGTVNFSGASFTLAPEGTVDMEIAGTDNPLGRIITSATTAMGGTLNLRYAQGYVPSIGDTFAVIPKGSGQFASVNPPPGRYLEPRYAGGLSLVAQASPKTMAAWLDWVLQDYQGPLPGLLEDLNHDGISLLEEYALGRKPLGPYSGPVFTHGYTGQASQGAAVPKAIPVGGIDYLAFTYVRPGGDSALTDVEYVAQRCSTLLSTDWLEDLVIQSVVLNPVTSMETVTVRSPVPYSPGSREFLRLKISTKN